MISEGETNDRNEGGESVSEGVSRREYLACLGAGSAAAAAVAGTRNVAAGGARTDADERDSRSIEGSENALVERFTELSRDIEWHQIDDTRLDFRTYHTQGMSRVDERFFLSSVEIRAGPEAYDEPRDGYDRSPGEGVGHLFAFDEDGGLIDEITLGEGIVYHPGGIDYDGEHLWVPVAEYRPDSRSIVYRVEPDSMEATEVFRFPDHVGGLVYDADDGALRGVSWGSRRFYRWSLTDSFEVEETDCTPNPEHYIDYQDCQYVGEGMTLCSGITNYQPPGAPEFSLGGIDLVDLRSNQPIYQLPVPVWTDDGVVMTRNPFYVERHDGGLRFYFVPEDDTSHLFVYDVEALSELDCSHRSFETSGATERDG